MDISYMSLEYEGQPNRDKTLFFISKDQLTNVSGDE